MSRRAAGVDRYVRPPLVAFEPPSPAATRRRLRAILLVVLIAIGVGAYFLARALLGSGEGNPGVGTAPPPHVEVALTALHEAL